MSEPELKLLLQLNKYTKTSLLDPKYTYHEDGDHMTHPEAHSGEDVYVWADRWTADLLVELNAYAKGRHFPVNGEYVLSEKEDREGAKVIAYVVNEQEVGWIQRETFNKAHEDVWRVGYHTGYRLGMYMNGHLRISRKRMQSDVGAPVKKIAKQCHKDMVYEHRANITAMTIDYIMTEEELDYLTEKLHAADFTTVTDTVRSDVGYVAMRAKIASEALMKFEVLREFRANVNRNLALPTEAGQVTKDSVTVTSVGVGSPGQMRSFMSQLQMAMGKRFEYIREVRVERGLQWNTDGANNTMYPNERVMSYTLETAPLPLDLALQISADIRRTDTWRECWATVMGEKLQGGAK